MRATANLLSIHSLFARQTIVLYGSFTAHLPLISFSFCQISQHWVEAFGVCLAPSRGTRDTTLSARWSRQACPGDLFKNNCRNSFPFIVCFCSFFFFLTKQNRKRPREDTRCPDLLLFIPLSQSLPMNMEIDWKPASASNPPVSILHSVGVTIVCVASPTLLYMC